MVQIETIQLNEINLDELSNRLLDGLRNKFEHCSVSVVDCPDLTRPPFNLAASGLCGRTAIADVGGVPYLLPLVKRDKIYSFKQIANIVDPGQQCFILGASAGPFHKIGHNSELMPNVLLEKSADEGFKIRNDLTHLAEIHDQNNRFRLLKSDHSEFGLLGDLFVSEGKPGKVLRIEVQNRKIIDNNDINDEEKASFTTIIRKILQESYPNQLISLGGVFLIEQGEAILHIMPDFSDVPLNTEQEVNDWLRFFPMKSPLRCLTTMHSVVDGYRNLRSEHTHCFSDHNQGGHYHNDIDPKRIKYLAYLNTAKIIYRIDKPSITNISK
ncbi:Ester hydrolase C11orf54 -like protein [Sarcoptes scabiei]|uniref:Ester hydrolase C11orf54 -like protein n=1 Tax=Sarcoptes scabiei TaxID=52283 RepID=A0A131ZWZ3_SARSC|nr:Ester hydrolase C11orf54 -like protein [Sarcoptes scabiei]KPM03187.1 ester hydrolase C11orf54-like protein [Sarcoptes scabiei]